MNRRTAGEHDLRLRPDESNLHEESHPSLETNDFKALENEHMPFFLPLRTSMNSEYTAKGLAGVRCGSMASTAAVGSYLHAITTQSHP